MADPLPSLSLGQGKELKSLRCRATCVMRCLLVNLIAAAFLLIVVQGRGSANSHILRKVGVSCADYLTASVVSGREVEVLLVLSKSFQAPSSSFTIVLPKRMTFLGQ